MKLRDSCNSLSASHQLAVFAEYYKYDSYSLLILTRCHLRYLKSFIFQLDFTKVHDMQALKSCQEGVSNHAYRGVCDLNDLMVIFNAIVFFSFSFRV